MPRNFLQQHFTQWLDNNAHRFNHPPCNLRYKAGGIQFNLQNTISEIEWEVNERGAMLGVSYKHNPFWDAIAECDVLECKTGNGQYYCGLCALDKDGIENTDNSTLYGTRKLLWETECFERILKLSNERVQPNYWLCYFDMGGSTFIERVPTSKLETMVQQKYFVKALAIQSNTEEAINKNR